MTPNENWAAKKIAELDEENARLKGGATYRNGNGNGEGKLAQARKWTSFVVALVTPALVGAVNIKIENQTLKTKAETDARFVSKEWFKSENDALKDSNSKLVESHAKLASSLAEMKLDVAVIKAEVKKINQ